LGGPVNITDSFHSLVKLGGSEQSHRGKIFAGKLFRGVDGELIDSHFVGLGGVRVVSLDVGKVLLENESSVSFFLRSPVDSKLSLPLLEGVSFGLVSRVVDCEECQ
jgi:hypothetical protein